MEFAILPCQLLKLILTVTVCLTFVLATDSSIGVTATTSCSSDGSAQSIATPGVASLTVPVFSIVNGGLSLLSSAVVTDTSTPASSIEPGGPEIPAGDSTHLALDADDQLFGKRIVTITTTTTHHFALPPTNNILKEKLEDSIPATTDLASLAVHETRFHTTKKTPDGISGLVDRAEPAATTRSKFAFTDIPGLIGRAEDATTTGPRIAQLSDIPGLIERAKDVTIMLDSSEGQLSGRTAGQAQFTGCPIDQSILVVKPGHDNLNVTFCAPATLTTVAIPPSKPDPSPDCPFLELLKKDAGTGEGLDHEATTSRPHRGGFVGPKRAEVTAAN